MKTAIIKRIQKWTTTVTSQAVDNILWRFQELSDRLGRVNDNLHFQSKKLDLNVQTALYNRWLDRPGIIFDRMELGYWLNFKGLLGEGVEVGVCRGDFSRILLDTWKGKLLHSVDPWKSFDKNVYVDLNNLDDDEHENNFNTTKRKLNDYGVRSNLVRKTSLEASSQFSDESLDFVYIDAQHHYEAVLEDIALWFPKIKVGGLICGHDYLDGRMHDTEFGVKSAVDEFVMKNNLELSVTRVDLYPSWFIEKTAKPQV